ncbi:MAG: prepilin-type N-terminal cleavage/methylation domain-containing protein [Candidatus Ozemobacteraceae bacterium]
MNHRSGFSLIEIVISLGLLALLILGFGQLGRISHAATMDATHELTALSLAREPIEIMKGLGYQALADYSRFSLPRFPLGESDLSDHPDGGAHFPVMTTFFKRHIALEPCEEAGIHAFRVIVTVYPKDGNRMSRSSFRLEGIVVEKPEW